ncbi:MAG: extensin family protein [Erythrobacter sp.]|uniref:extensin family protein n=1 Tax=Erythrobacter sp. TaxID=1042 RepID=UPI0032EE253E
MKRKLTLFRFASAPLAALALASCGSVIPAPAGVAPGAAVSASSATSPPPITRPANRLASAPRGYRSSGPVANCIADLGASGARFEPLPDTYAAPGCNKLGTVRLSALSGDDGMFGISNLGPVKCGTAKAFTDWARFGVDRAARQILGSPLMRIETMGSYACRNVAGTDRRSAHARAEAIDVSGFVLEDGRRITLSGDWNDGTAAEREFLRVVHRSACKRFGTVLGPQYNAAHRDHFHLEGTGPRFCR